MQIKKYSEILGKTKEKIDELMAPVRVYRIKKLAESEISKLEGEIFRYQSEFEEGCLQFPLNFELLINLRDNIELLERKIDQYKEIVKELFGE